MIPPKEKRRSRRYAIAFLLGADLGEVSEYQPTRRDRIPIFMSDSTDVLLCATRQGERLPSSYGYAWKHIGSAFNYEIYESIEPEEDDNDR